MESFKIGLLAVTYVLVATVSGICISRLFLPTSPTAYTGSCIHPLVNGGALFNVKSATWEDGKLGVTPDNGPPAYITGALCILKAVDKP